MAVTGLNLYTEIAYVLIESPVDGSTEFTDDLYTRTEIMARLNYRQEEFNKRTGVYIKNNATSSVTSGETAVDLPSDVIDLMDVGVTNTGSTIPYNNIPKGSVYEVDLFTTNDGSSANMANLYCLEDAPQLSMRIFPPLNGAGTARFCYIPKTTVLPSPPDSTALNVPDDLTPFVKYGALSDLFGKSGETYDPFREEVCRQLYELGIEISRAWVSGGQS